MPSHRKSIQTALQAFQTRPLRQTTLDLLGTPDSSADLELVTWLVIMEGTS